MSGIRALLQCPILGVCFMAAAASAADVKLSTAWMRPAAAGAASAMAYVDMQSDAPVELIGATTPVAQAVVIVVVGHAAPAAASQVPPSAIAEAPGKVVTTVALPANKMVRLAYLGDHLRLVQLNKAVGNGDVVPLTLRFKTMGGEILQRQIDIEVRGLVSPPANDGRGVGMRLDPSPNDGPRLPVPPPTK